MHRRTRVGRSREGGTRLRIGRVADEGETQSHDKEKQGAHGGVELYSNNKAPPEESGKRSLPCYSWARP